MRIKVKTLRIISITCLIAALAAPPAFCGEDIEYKQFRLDNVSCDVATAHKVIEGRPEIVVCAVCYGKGAEFRKWNVTDIRLVINGERIRPDTSGLFFVRKESLFRFPAAIVFAAIASQTDTSGPSIRSGITDIGAVVGFGLLVAQAKGEISGKRCTFNMDWKAVEKIEEGRDVIEITTENSGLHLKETLKVVLQKEPEAEARFDYGKMKQDELMQVIDTLDGQVATLKKNLENYRYGVDPEYDSIQKKIEGLEAERGLAHIESLRRKE